MFLFASSVFGLASGFTFRAYALLVLSPLCFVAGMLSGAAAGQEPGRAFWFGLLLMAAFQLAYLLGVFGEAWLKRD